LRQVSEKALPLPFPHALVMPAQGTPERTSEIGVEEEVIHMNGAEGVHSEDTSPHTRFTVLECGLASSFSSFGYCLLDRHRCCSPHLPLREWLVLILIPTSER